MAKKSKPFDPAVKVPTAQPLNPKGLSGKLAQQRPGREMTLGEQPSEPLTERKKPSFKKGAP